MAVPYFETYDSLEAIDKALNEHPEEPCVHMLNERGRCSRGLVVAKLVKRPNYDELLRIYDEKVLRLGPVTYKKYFRPLVEDLEQLRDVE